MFEATLLPTAKPRATLPPNLYSAQFLLAAHFGMRRKEIIKVQLSADCSYKIYSFHGRLYTVHRVDEEPPAGYDWKPIARSRGRGLYETLVSR